MKLILTSAILECSSEWLYFIEFAWVVNHHPAGFPSTMVVVDLLCSSGLSLVEAFSSSMVLYLRSGSFLLFPGAQASAWEGWLQSVAVSVRIACGSIEETAL